MNENNENIEISAENKENTKEVEESSKIVSSKKLGIIKYIFYVLVLIFSIIFNNSLQDTNFVLGDFGSIIPILLNTISMMGIKWLPIFSILGMLVTKFEEKLKDISNSFFIVIIIITVVSFGLQIIL